MGASSEQARYEIEEVGQMSSSADDAARAVYRDVQDQEEGVNGCTLGTSYKREESLVGGVFVFQNTCRSFLQTILSPYTRTKDAHRWDKQGIQPGLEHDILGV